MADMLEAGGKKCKMSHSLSDDSLVDQEKNRNDIIVSRCWERHRYVYSSPSAITSQWPELL